MKLGLCKDSTRFPHSGGYVWISDGQAKKFTSVYKGSIFDSRKVSPTIVLKLIYHWSCQTPIEVSKLSNFIHLSRF